jgi:hypothetical protein
MTTVFNYLRKEFLTLALLAGAAIYSMGGQGGHAVNLSPGDAMKSSYHSVMHQSPVQGIRSTVRSYMPSSFNGFSFGGKGGSRSFAIGTGGPIFLS